MVYAEGAEMAPFAECRRPHVDVYNVPFLTAVRREWNVPTDLVVNGAPNLPDYYSGRLEAETYRNGDWVRINSEGIERSHKERTGSRGEIVTSAVIDRCPRALKPVSASRL
jgi:hypothetical protein